MRLMPCLPHLPQCPRPTLWRPAALALVAAATLLGAASAQAQWKWRDASGRITVSDRPPPREVPEKDILSRPQNLPVRGPAVVATAATPAAAGGTAPAATPGGAAAPAAPAASAPPTALEREVQARRRAAEAEQAAKAKADEERAAARRAENCRMARSQLAGLESGQRIARVNDKGEREVLDDQARAQETARAREVIASECR
jgi:hypothetical protein